MAKTTLESLTITGILEVEDKDVTAQAKLNAISAIVAKAKASYGNTDVEIKAPVVPSCEGNVDIQFLSAKDKLAVVANQVKAIRQKAVETVKVSEGTVLETEIIRLIAINPVLSNCTATSDSAFL